MGRTPAQAGRMARRKGMKFQNQVAKMLSEAWGMPVLWTPMSGGLSIRGDLMIGGDPPKHVLLYNIECKHRQDVTLRRVLDDANRIPVTPKQIVVFKDDGRIWLAWDVRQGPALAPFQFSMRTPPVFIRVIRPGDGGDLVGLVQINGDPGVEYLRCAKSVLVRKATDSLGRPKKLHARKGVSADRIDADLRAL